MAGVTNYYELFREWKLGVDESSATKAIWNALDLESARIEGSIVGTSMKAEDRARMDQIEEAMKVFSSDEKRAEYDRTLKAGQAEAARQAQEPSPEMKKVAKLYSKARMYLGAGDIDSAKRAIEDTIREYERDPDREYSDQLGLYHEAGRIYAAAGDLKKAVEYEQDHVYRSKDSLKARMQMNQTLMQALSRYSRAHDQKRVSDEQYKEVYLYCLNNMKNQLDIAEKEAQGNKAKLAMVYDQYAVLYYYVVGDHKRALEYARKSIEMGGSYEDSKKIFELLDEEEKRKKKEAEEAEKRRKKAEQEAEWKNRNGRS